MTALIQNLVGGLALGSVYAILAVGLVLIYRSTRVLNFAHGSIATLAAFVAYALSQARVPLLLALVLGVVAAVIVGGVSYRLVLSRIRSGGPHSLALGTIGAFMVIEGALGLMFGTDTKSFAHLFADAGVLSFGGVAVTWHNLWLLTAAIVLTVALGVFWRSRLGIALRALSENEIAARAVGLDVPRLELFAWCFASMLAAIAGILLSPKLLLEPSMMFVPVLKAFAAAVLGGLRSTRGAILGGWFLGALEALIGAYVSVALASTIAFVVIICALVVRPEGLFSPATD